MFCNLWALSGLTIGFIGLSLVLSVCHMSTWWNVAFGAKFTVRVLLLVFLVSSLSYSRLLEAIRGLSWVVRDMGIAYTSMLGDSS